MKFVVSFGVIIMFTIVTKSQEINLKHLRCLVCRKTIDELKTELGNINPTREIEIGNYRMDAKGNTIRKKVPLIHSEVHLSDVLDSICEKMADYVRATYKSTGQLTVLRIMTPSGGLNPEMSNVNIIQDGDMNKSLKFYCEGIIEEFEESIIDLMRKGGENTDIKICKEITNLCNDAVFDHEEDIEFEEDKKKEEL